MTGREIDGFVQLRDSSGNEVWTQQFGTDRSELVHAIARATDGIVYVGGTTDGSFPGYINAGEVDALLAVIKP